MKTIKKYEDFINEEINIKKALAGAALGASLLGGMSSCKKSDIKPSNPIEQNTPDIKVDIKININNCIPIFIRMFCYRFPHYMSSIINQNVYARMISLNFI